MDKTRNLLILKYKDFHNETSKFFKELNKEPELRSLFFTNPSLVLRTKLPSLSNIDISDQQNDLANKVLFSALSNERFMKFLTDYQQKKNKALKRLLKSPKDKQAALELDERTVRMEFAEAMLEFADKELVSNLLGSGSIAKGVGNPPVLVSYAILVTWVVFILGIHVIIHTVVRLALIGNSELTATGKTPIPASELRKIAEQLVAAAKQARETGDLVK